MEQSAPSLRERRQAETTSALRSEARRLTAERGFSGFTVEELCSEVGVSRRTFFNYYPSKENAVLGIPVRDTAGDLEAAFVLAGGPLVDDLVDLHIQRWHRMTLTKAEAEELGRVFEREPRLFAHFIGLAAEGERDDIALVQRRPDAGDALRAATVVHVIGALLRPTMLEYFGDEGSDFPTLFLRRVDAARDIFTS